MGSSPTELSSIYAGTMAEMAFDLCDVTAECLGRLELGAITGYLFIPDGGT